MVCFLYGRRQLPLARLDRFFFVHHLQDWWGCSQGHSNYTPTQTARETTRDLKNLQLATYVLDVDKGSCF